MGHRCPTCRKPVKEGEKHFPFCSDRCRWVDLGRWLDEDYRIPVSGPSSVSGEGVEEGATGTPTPEPDHDGEDDGDRGGKRPGGSS